MLPLVGVVAIGLLLVAGKLFFLSGTQPDRPELPVISTPPAVARQEKSAQAETPPSPTQKTTQPPAAVPLSVDAPETRRLPAATLDVLAVPYDSRATSPTTNTSSSGGKSSSVTVTSVPVARQNQNTKASQKPPVKERQTRPPAEAAKPKPATSSPTQEKKAAPVAVPKPEWQVQVGAYSTRAAADSVVEQLKKAGYPGTIVSGKTLSRVLVQAGATRDNALATATKLSRSGFPGAFIVPPRP